MERKASRSLLRIILALTFVLFATATWQVFLLSQEAGKLIASSRWVIVLVLGILGTLVCLGLLLLTWTPLWNPLQTRLTSALSLLQRLRYANGLFLLALLVGYGYLLFGPWGRYLTSYLLRLGLFWLIALAGCPFWKAMSIGIDNSPSAWLKALATSWLSLGVVHRIAAFSPAISTYPFSLDWSEASRYYYASLFFGERIYGVQTVPSALHPSRYLLQAIPFLVPGLPLWFHRLWQVLLWLGLTFCTAFLLARRVLSSWTNQDQRLGLSKAHTAALFTAWVFLFLFLGPVYYHLQVCVVVVLLSFDARRLGKTTLGVLLASAWAGISRINWYPLPALLASTLYFLECSLPNYADALASPIGARRKFVVHLSTWARYLFRPVLWAALGIATAFLAQLAYVHWAGIDPRVLSSSFTSDLLWYRLLPNATFPLGVLPMILLISAPLLLLVARNLRGVHWLRSLGIALILAVFFGGGLVVSTKIGGGSNLHNLDAFLVLLLVTAASGWGERLSSLRPPTWLLLAVLTMPVLYTIGEGEPLDLPKRERTEKTLAVLRQLTNQSVAQGGEVLFISQRHLLTFGYLPGVRLVEPYENVFLMEMVMAGNSAYLEPFYEALRQKRFALIVSDPQPSRLKGRAFPFGEENDVWLQRVTKPLLDSYQRIEVFKEVGMELYVPKP